MQSIPASPRPQSPRPSATWLMALKVAGIYAGSAAAWIIVSDLVVINRTGGSRELLWLEISKGLAFVAVTTALLVLLVRHYLRIVQKAESLQWAGEPQFRSLVQQSIVGVYLIQDGRPVYVNPRLAEIFGYTPAEITERLSVSDLVAAADRAAVRERLASRLRGEHPGDIFYFHGLHRQGWPLQLEAYGNLVEHHGRPAIIGTLLDVTDRHEAEAALRESEARYRLLIQSAPDAIVVFDVDQGRFVDYNQRAEQLFEMSGEELSRHGPAELSPEVQPDGRRSADVAMAQIKEAIAGGTPTFEWIHRSRTGRDIPCEIRLVRLPAHGRILIRGSITDITERRRTAQALERSEENYRQLFEQASGAIFLCDKDGRVVDVNRTAVSLTGFTREELLRKDVFGVIAADDHEYLRLCLQELQRQGTRFSVYRFLRKDGSIFHGETSTKLLADGRLLAITRDITEQRLAEEHRRKLEEELRQAQKLQAIGTLAGGIAHDFNNILAAILGNAQLLKLMLPPENEGHGKVAQILVASNRAKDLVQQILMFSSQRDQEKRILQLAPVVAEAAKLIEVNLPPAIRLQVDVAHGLPAVLADPTQIHQVVVNLCTNGAHAMRESGGTLAVSLASVALPAQASQSKPGLPPGRYVCLKVADTGHGMSAATLERIYEPFFTTKSVGDGTGLGLAVVHGIVQSHNGSIFVSSEPGRGTTFSLYFPAEADDGGVEAGPVAKPPTGQNQHILFVDDEVPIADVARVMLPRLGYRVSVFTKPQEALEHFRLHSADIDLLMTDLSMPGLTGVELIREAVGIKPALCAVLLTGYGKALDSRAATGLNIREVITKPFTMEILAAAIQGALPPRH